MWLCTCPLESCPTFVNWKLLYIAALTSLWPLSLRYSNAGCSNWSFSLMRYRWNFFLINPICICNSILRYYLLLSIIWHKSFNCILSNLRYLALFLRFNYRVYSLSVRLAWWCLATIINCSILLSYCCELLHLFNFFQTILNIIVCHLSAFILLSWFRYYKAAQVSNFRSC